MLVFARRSLVPAHLPATRRTLLLEGSWPSRRGDQAIAALDDVIDAANYGWIDEAAVQLAETVVNAAESPTNRDSWNLAATNILALRYAAVKWIRQAAYVRSVAADCPEIDLFVDGRRDGEYVAMWRGLADAYGFMLRTHNVLTRRERIQRAEPAVAWWRRLLTRQFADRRPAKSGGSRVLLCGNPRLLDGVCQELLRRGTSVAWLFDQFAVGPWRRYGRSVEWLTCHDPTRPTPVAPPVLFGRVMFDGIDYGDAAEQWLRAMHASRGTQQARQRSAVAEHCRKWWPTHVVVDEDATPLKRILLTETANRGARSVVVQHGVCGIRFGFAPLLADAFCAADDGAAKQLRRWGIDAERISVTGSPYQEGLVAAVQAKSPTRGDRFATAKIKRIALMLTTPPRDDRPDAIEFHFTSVSYAAMLRFALEAVAEIPGVELIVRHHPRAHDDGDWQSALQSAPGIRARQDVRADLAELLAECDCVLSCASTSGLDAAAAGLPVVQLLPPGSGDLVPAAWYGLLGTARSLAEARELLQAALSQSRSLRPTNARGTAARRIVDVLLNAAASPQTVPAASCEVVR